MAPHSINEESTEPSEEGSADELKREQIRRLGEEVMDPSLTPDEYTELCDQIERLEGELRTSE